MEEPVLTDSERVAKMNYVKAYKELLIRYKDREYAESRARAVALHMTKKRFGAAVAEKVRDSYHGT